MEYSRRPERLWDDTSGRCRWEGVWKWRQLCCWWRRVCHNSWGWNQVVGRYRGEGRGPTSRPQLRQGRQLGKHPYSSFQISQGWPLQKTGQKHLQWTPWHLLPKRCSYWPDNCGLLQAQKHRRLFVQSQASPSPWQKRKYNFGGVQAEIRSLLTPPSFPSARILRSHLRPCGLRLLAPDSAREKNWEKNRFFWKCGHDKAHFQPPLQHNSPPPTFTSTRKQKPWGTMRFGTFILAVYCGNST